MLIVAASYPTPSTGKDKGQQPSAGSQPDSGRAPIANTPGQSVSLTVQNVTGQPSKSEEAKDSAHNGWLGPEGALALLTAILAWVTWRLVVRTRELVDEAKRTSDRQAGETEKALSIAQEAADTAKQSADTAVRSLAASEEKAQMQLRAYVWRESSDSVLIERSDALYRVEFHIRNSGQTPASNVRVWAQLAAYDSELTRGFTFEPAPEWIGGSSFVVNPGSFHTQSVAFNSESATEDLELAQGLKALYQWGEIRYQDVFGKERRTRFRLRLLLWNKPGGERFGIWTYCDEGNDAT